MSDEIEHDKPDAITRLRAENERLRAALEEIVIHCDWPDRVEKYARAALEGE